MTAIQIDSVSKSFSNHQALTNITLNIPSESVFGILGPNGAGKTTLIRLLNRILLPDHGTIHINSEILNDHHRSLIGYLPEERGLYKKMTVDELLTYLAMLKGMKKKTVKEEIGLWLSKLDISDLRYRRIEEFSKGMQQKVQFIATVIHKPKIVILDEPFSGFDPINAQLIRSEILSLKKMGCTLLISTHNMHSVEELCNNIALINNSKLILEGVTNEIQNQFSPPRYLIDFKGILPNLSDDLFSIISIQFINDKFEAIIELHKNELNLRKVIDFLNTNIELHAIKPIISSMDDIFVHVVNQDKLRNMRNE